jgi:hypothetical protein
MSLVTTIIERLSSPTTPLWLKLSLAVVLIAAVIVWLVKPPHWADFEGPDKRPNKRAARPPR